MTVSRRRIHLLRKNADINREGHGLGICFTLGQVSSKVGEIDCKVCIKRLKEEK